MDICITGLLPYSRTKMWVTPLLVLITRSRAEWKKDLPDIKQEPNKKPTACKKHKSYSNIRMRSIQNRSTLSSDWYVLGVYSFVTRLCCSWLCGASISVSDYRIFQREVWDGCSFLRGSHCGASDLGQNRFAQEWKNGQMKTWDRLANLCGLLSISYIPAALMRRSQILTNGIF